MNRSLISHMIEAPLVRGLTYDDAVRIFWIDNTAPMRELLERTGTEQPEAIHALAESFSAACLLSGTLKDGQRLTFKMSSTLLGLWIMADAEASGSVRAYIDAGSEAASGTHQTSERSASDTYGTIRCVSSSASGQFTGITDLPHRSMARGIEHYFRQSEQNEICIRTRLDLRGGRCHSSEAVFAQLLPNAPEGLLRRVAASLDGTGPLWDLEPVRSMRTLDELPVRWQCYCSQEMLAGMAGLLERSGSAADSEANVKSGEAVCRICGQRYQL
ncbi:hypothetical protein B9G55_09390 [Saccharibacillus sp. O16]|nr:hypothetical protein B9G55_09390 [Saccharibacillus sp. O16]